MLVTNIYWADDGEAVAKRNQTVRYTSSTGKSTEGTGDGQADQYTASALTLINEGAYEGTPAWARRNPYV